MDLYNLLPAVIRQQDERTGIAGQTILQGFIYALEQESIASDTLITGLSDLLTADSCPTAYLPLLEAFLGSSWPSSWPESRQRLIVKATVDLYHKSGQRLSWVAILNLLGYAGFFPWELWKQEIYEDMDYFLYGGGNYYGLYHAARVDIRQLDESLVVLPFAEEQLLENFRPIHVLIRRAGERITVTDTIAKSILDTVSPSASLVVNDVFSSASESFAVVVSCIATCEVACEVGVEVLLAVVDWFTGNPVILSAATLLYQSDGSTLYTGTIGVTDLATSAPIILRIIAGFVYEETGVSLYTGTIAVVDPTTGANQIFMIVNGEVLP